MYYIFNTEGSCLCSCDLQPDVNDLTKRGECFVERTEIFDITQICLINGQIQEKTTSTDSETETETADSSISNEILDLAEILLDMSDTTKALQKGGETS